jgi:hypothetical protein
MIYDAAAKTGEGRETRSPGKVPEVETLACPSLLAHGRTHQMSNRTEFSEVVTRCDHCGRTWAELDAEARVAVPARIQKRDGGRAA